MLDPRKWVIHHFPYTQHLILILDNLLAFLVLGTRYVPPVVSIASLVGFITLFGIAARNGILLVNHFRWLMVE